MRAVPYFIVYVLPAAFVVGLVYGGFWLWLTPIIVFGILPVVDLLVGRDVSEPADGSRRNPLYDLALFLWVPVQLSVMVAGLWRVSQGVSTGEFLAIAVSLGLITGGGGINVAHELMHRKGKLEQGLAEVLMGLVSYSWFCVEHVLGHHRRVATHDDPATAKLGQPVWGFVPQSVVGGLVSAWGLERERCARRGIPRWSLKDRRLRYALSLGLLYAGVFSVAGAAALGLLVAQSVIAVGLLETINYVEHYGLERQVLTNGQPERVMPHHSWNATQRVTNWFLFNLQRHSDHHAWASRPYDQLRNWPDAPELPQGYAPMLLLAWVPPVWFAVMNPRVRAAREAQPVAAK